MSRTSGSSSTLWIYLPYVDESATGMGRFASEMIVALRRSGLEFTLLLGEVQGSPAWLRDIPHRLVFRPEAVRRLPRFAIAIGRLVWLQFRFAHVAGRSATLLALAGELAPFPSFRQVGVAHDLTDLRAFAGRASLGVRVRNALWAAGLRRSLATIAISRATRRDVIDTLGLPPDRVHVVYEGFDPATFAPAPNAAAAAGTRFLLYAGTLDPHKNLAFALKVFACLRAEGRPLQFRLVGRQPADRVAALLAAIPPDIRRDVRFEGFVSDAQLADLMRGCAAFIFPSRNEGFGLAPVEAMACGAAVIAAAAGSLPEVVGEGGVLLDPDDVDGWTRHVGRVLDEPDYARELRARALARASLFSWDRAATGYRAILADPTTPASPVPPAAPSSCA